MDNNIQTTRIYIKLCSKVTLREEASCGCRRLDWTPRDWHTADVVCMSPAHSRCHRSLNHKRLFRFLTEDWMRPQQPSLTILC